MEYNNKQNTGGDSKAPSKKQLQISALIQKEFSTVLQQEGSFIYDPSALVTVTRVRMSHDLGIAYIYLSVFNVDYKQGVIKDLWDNLSRLRGALGKRIGSQMRRVPALKFFIDDVVDEMQRVEALFQRLEQEQSGMRSMKEAMEERAAKQAAAQENSGAEESGKQ